MTKRQIETADEADARYFFEVGLRLHTVRVAEGRPKKADYLVDGEPPGYVVEVKSRHDSEDVARAWRHAGRASVLQSTSFHRWTVDAARNAEKQMSTLDPMRERWWVLWVSVQCELAAEVVFDQIVGSLYGVRQIAYWDGESGGMASRDCLLAVVGAFERYSSLDAAVVAHGNGIRLCVNDLRDDTKRFSSSALYQSFAKRHPPISVSDLSQNRGFLKVDPRVIAARDENSVRRYVEQTYGLQHVYVLHMKVTTAVARVEVEGGA